MPADLQALKAAGCKVISPDELFFEQLGLSLYQFLSRKHAIVQTGELLYSFTAL